MNPWTPIAECPDLVQWSTITVENTFSSWIIRVFSLLFILQIYATVEPQRWSATGHNFTTNYLFSKIPLVIVSNHSLPLFANRSRKNIQIGALFLPVNFNFQHCEYIATNSIQAFYWWYKQINNPPTIKKLFSNEAKLDLYSSVNATGVVLPVPSSSFFTMQARWSTSCCGKVNLLFESKDTFFFFLIVCPTQKTKWSQHGVQSASEVPTGLWQIATCSVIRVGTHDSSLHLNTFQPFVTLTWLLDLPTVLLSSCVSWFVQPACPNFSSITEPKGKISTFSNFN